MTPIYALPNYMVTSTLGNPKSPSRIDIIGTYHTITKAQQEAVRVLSNGYYAPSTIKTAKSVKVINKQFIPLVVFIERTDSKPNLTKRQEDNSVIHQTKKWVTKLKYKTLYCNCCKKEKLEDKTVFPYLPLTMLCSKCESKIVNIEASGPFTDSDSQHNRQT